MAHEYGQKGEKGLNHIFGADVRILAKEEVIMKFLKWVVGRRGPTECKMCLTMGRCMTFVLQIFRALEKEKP